MIKKKVLIIDDEPINRFILNKVLEQSGFEAIEAENGQAALDTLQLHKDIRIALLDLNMPILDGYGFLHKLSEDAENATRELSIIVVSASCESSFFKGVDMMGLDTSRVIGYMCKPVQIDKLVQMMVKIA